MLKSLVSGNLYQVRVSGGAGYTFYSNPPDINGKKGQLVSVPNVSIIMFLSKRQQRHSDIYFLSFLHGDKIVQDLRFNEASLYPYLHEVGDE